MLKYTSINGYSIIRNTISTKLVNDIANDLTVAPLETSYTEITDDDIFTLYRFRTPKLEQDKIIRSKFKSNMATHDPQKEFVIPRFYGYERIGKPDCEIYNETKLPKLSFNGKLRDYQVDIVNTCLKHIEKHKGGILCVPCGYGKTSMSLYISTILKVKTLILVHKSFLLDQWVDRIKQFTNARIGIIQQDTFDVKNKDIVIAMVQSLTRRNYSPNELSKFGLLIVDECHHYGAQHFSKALAKMSTKYTIGLSATLERNDGLTKVIKWYLGEIMFEKKLKTNNQVVVKNIHFYSHSKKFAEKKKWIKGSVKACCVTMITSLTKLDSRNRMILDILNHLRLTTDRKILVLSGRVDHLKLLKTSFDDIIKSDSKDSKDKRENDCNTYYYIGSTKEAARREAEKKCDVLFSTYEMASEGLDIERLNTIILTTSKRSATQSVGRVLRKVLGNGDIRPMIIDIADVLSVFINQSSVRRTLYASSDYVIQKYYAYDGNYTSQKNFISYMKEEKRVKKIDCDVKLEDVLYAPVVNDELDKDNMKNTKSKSNTKNTKNNKSKKTKQDQDIEPVEIYGHKKNNRGFSDVCLFD